MVQFRLCYLQGENISKDLEMLEINFSKCHFDLILISQRLLEANALPQNYHLLCIGQY